MPSRTTWRLRGSAPNACASTLALACAGCALPIPANTEYVAGSAKPGAAKASVDAHAFGALPLKRRVVRDGKEVEESVPLREYRYLRWYPGELAADQSVSFTARVKVLEDTGPDATNNRGGGK